MKKKAIILIAVLFAFAITAFAETYYYNFVLSCGKEIFTTSEKELSAKELLRKQNSFEKKYCKKVNTEDPETKLVP